MGLVLAEILNIPAVNLVQAVELQGNKIKVEKLKRIGYEVVAAALPALVTVSSEAGELRRPTLRAIQETRKKPVTIWKAADLGIDPGGLKKITIRELFPPPSRARNSFFIEGESAQEKGRILAFKLRQDGIV